MKCSSASDIWPFIPEQEPVVEVSRVIEAVFVADQRAGHAAELEELMPVGGVAGKPGALQTEHDPGPAEGYLGDQLLEPFHADGWAAGLGHHPILPDPPPPVLLVRWRL
jgi:hypothetical protein